MYIYDARKIASLYHAIHDKTFKVMPPNRLKGRNGSKVLPEEL